VDQSRGEVLVTQAIEWVEDEVRDLVARRGVDPANDHDAMRSLIDEVITRYDERALVADLPSVNDATSMAGEVFDAVAGFGPLQRLLDDPTVEEIWINERLTTG
jgi:pilus assembly protein CpaF